jgi:hypothetical protein
MCGWGSSFMSLLRLLGTDIILWVKGKGEGLRDVFRTRPDVVYT